MTLTPNTRSTLVEALQAPSSYKLDAAVATTYSLDLVALLLATLSFDQMDGMDEGAISRMDPIRRLEAARRYGEATTVFSQAGAIHQPSNYYPPFVFVEDTIVEVAPPPGSHLFHPRMWVLRFRPESHSDASTNYLHRVMVLSRNLTMDNSWDTILVLDEDPEGTIEAAPVADFIRSLPRLAVRRITDEHAERVADVAQTLRPVRLSAPPPYTGGYLKGIGLDKRTFWPFPTAARRVLAISPFLTDSPVRKLERLPAVGTKNARILVSRAESLDALDPKCLGRFATKTLIDDLPVGDQTLEGQVPLSEATELALKEHHGLHAKTYIVDLNPLRNKPDTSITVTGSANLTSPRWGNSVEFVAVLEGPTVETGVVATYHGTRYRGGDGLEPIAGAEGLSALLVDHRVSQQVPLPGSVDLTRAMEQYHRDLAQALPKLNVIADVDDPIEPAEVPTVRLDWSFEKSLPRAPEGSRTTMWLLSAKPATMVEGVPARGTWRVSRESITPFIAIETRISAGGGEMREEVTRRCLLKASLTGDTDWRRKEQMFDVLKSIEDILRYMMFVLGEPTGDASRLNGNAGELGVETGQGGAGLAPIIFERLVRATGRDSDALGRIAELLKDLADHPNLDAVDLRDFYALWDAVWVVHKEVVADEDH